jgi:hypothetical protein
MGLIKIYRNIIKKDLSYCLETCLNNSLNPIFWAYIWVSLKLWRFLIIYIIIINYLAALKIIFLYWKKKEDILTITIDNKKKIDIYVYKIVLLSSQKLSKEEIIETLAAICLRYLIVLIFSKSLKSLTISCKFFEQYKEWNPCYSYSKYWKTKVFLKNFIYKEFFQIKIIELEIKHKILKAIKIKKKS